MKDRIKRLRELLEEATRRLPAEITGESSAIDSTPPGTPRQDRPIRGVETKPGDSKVRSYSDHARKESVSEMRKSKAEELPPSRKDLNRLPLKQKETSTINEQVAASMALTKPAHRVRFVLAISITLVIVGSVTLLESVIVSSTTLTFVGLGLTFWGLLFIFVRPSRYARVELVDSTALSSVQAVDRIIYDMGFHGRGIYMPLEGHEWATLFVPADSNSSTVPNELSEATVIQSNPKGMTIVPPGLELAKFFLQKITKGSKSKLPLEKLREKLPEVLTSDLEIMKEFEMKIEGDMVYTKSFDSIYSNFCDEIKFKTRVCAAFGCPICSAVACLLVYATNQPVRLETDDSLPVGRVSESAYRILPPIQIVKKVAAKVSES